VTQGVHLVEVEAWNSLDTLVRIVNTARRARLAYREVRAVLAPGGLVRVLLVAEGDGAEASWLAAKLERLPEVYSVEHRVRRAGGEELPPA